MDASSRRPAARALAALLLPAAGIAALAGCGGREPGGPLELPSDAERCRANLREIHRGLVEYVRERGGPPEVGGVRFFAVLVAEGLWPSDAEHAAALTCPGVPTTELDLPPDPADGFASLEGLSGESSAYAGRDVERHPLDRLPGPGVEALVACDNRRGPNHDGVTNVLMADGSVLSLELDHEIEAGNVPADAERIVVGPDSPLELLRTLSQE